MTGRGDEPRLTAAATVSVAAVLVTVILMPVAGCRPVSKQPDKAESGAPVRSAQVFDCGDVTVSPTFEDDAVTLETPQGRYRLTRVPAASGAKYEGPEATFWAHQDRAMVTLAGTTLPECALRTGQ